MSSFFTGGRWGLRGNFTVEEILFLRLLGGALVTIPIMFKIGFLVRNQGLINILMVTLGSSSVFPFLIPLGLFYAPASDAGVIIPGMFQF